MGWVQRNCDQFFTGLLQSEGDPNSYAVAQNMVLHEIGLPRECFLLMKDFFEQSQSVFQVMQSHVLSRINISVGRFHVGSGGLLSVASGHSLQLDSGISIWFN